MENRAVSQKDSSVTFLRFPLCCVVLERVSFQSAIILKEDFLEIARVIAFSTRYQGSPKASCSSRNRDYYEAMKINTQEQKHLNDK